MTVSTTCAKCRVKREMVHQMRAWSQIVKNPNRNATFFVIKT